MTSSSSQTGGATGLPLTGRPASAPGHLRGARRRRAAGALAAALTLMSPAACRSDSERTSACQAEPAGSILVFFESPGEGGSRRIEATVTGVQSMDAGFTRVTLRDSSGTAESLKYRGAGEALPISAGQACDIRIDFTGGVPPASAIVLRDPTGLLFAAATDQSIGGHVLREGLPEFRLELVESDCPSRKRDRCYDSITNSILRVSHGGQTRDLRHGQSVSLGAYRVTCLTAQRVEYSNECSDAGLPAVSYVIAREDRTPQADKP